MSRLSPFQAIAWTTVGVGALCAGAGTAQAQSKQTNLASGVGGLATITDPNLVNTWGVAAIPGGSPFWISNQGTGTTSLFSVTSKTGVAQADLPPPAAPATNFLNILPPVVGGSPGPTRLGFKSGRGVLWYWLRRTRAIHFRKSERLNFGVESIAGQQFRRDGVCDHSRPRLHRTQTNTNCHSG